MHKIGSLLKFGISIVITGCTRGIGLCYAQELAKRGMNLILIGRNEKTLQDISKQIENQYKVETIVLAVNFANGPDMYEEIKPLIDGKDIGMLVNNVGVIPPYPMYFEETPEATIWDIVKVNMAACTMMTKIVLPILVKKNKGVIVNLSSSAAIDPQPLQGIYTASKAYVSYFSRALAYEYPKLTIQTVNPMYVCTDMVAFSDTLNKPSIFVPSAETFVKQAVSTIGFASCTTGYWSHSLQTALMGCLPIPKIAISKLMNDAFRSRYLKKSK